METRTHRLYANGLNHHVRDSGDDAAPVALLLHGFPDTGAVWDRVTPRLTEAGFRIIAPDMRGFGESDMAGGKAGYDINAGAIPDSVEILRQLGVEAAHVVGHDFGAPVAWGLAARYPSLFRSLTAVSVGHARAYLRAGPAQMARSWYVVMHQMRGLCEALYRAGDWRLLRRHWSSAGDVDAVIANLSRPGRLTAALDWYRANLSLARMLRQPPMGAFGEEIVRAPTLGVWSDGEAYLTEKQMRLSEDYVEAPWRYCRIDGASHWIQLDAPDALAGALIAHWRAA